MKHILILQNRLKEQKLKWLNRNMVNLTIVHETLHTESFKTIRAIKWSLFGFAQIISVTFYMCLVENTSLDKTSILHLQWFAAG